jgi:hypothetical protein
MSRIPLRTPQTTLKYDLEDDEFYLSKASRISTLTLLRVAESKIFHLAQGRFMVANLCCAGSNIPETYSTNWYFSPAVPVTSDSTLLDLCLRSSWIFPANNVYSIS